MFVSAKVLILFELAKFFHSHLGIWRDFIWEFGDVRADFAVFLTTIMTIQTIISYMKKTGKTTFVSYRSLRALDVKSQTVIAKSPCRSVCQCLTETLHLPAALYDTKEKQEKPLGLVVGFWLLVFG